MFCGNCGTKLTEGIEVCPKCGHVNCLENKGSMRQSIGQQQENQQQINQKQAYSKQENQDPYRQQSYQQFQSNGNVQGQTEGQTWVWLKEWSQTHNLGKDHVIGIIGSAMIVLSVFMPLFSVSEFGYKESVTFWLCFNEVLNAAILGPFMIACGAAASVLYFYDKVMQALFADIGASCIGLFSIFAILAEIGDDYRPITHLDFGGYIFFAGIIVCIVAQVKHVKG